ncbi:pyrroloquinoline quinone-dependent dehydrogenase [Terrimonas pollutisoli]|uniref:pyrroloquinoline quinone-dependent dehydrogenase n=1 Tax=Terrimonas pollutisoli TaxID=3034147 RepID=UPI0023EC49A1|nr:pyrroloquinoline quinone-dependent dehydrogenase [Terrimonas sp. H1YJ31]
MKKNIIATVLFVFFIAVGHTQSVNQSQSVREANFVAGGQWANYANDPGGMRYSPVGQINPSNVKTLKPAWTYQSGELKTYEGTNIGAKAAFEATPLMIDGVLYFSTPSNRVIAIDGASGKELWVYDPKVNLKGDYSEITSRGVSKWINNKRKPGDNDYMRILSATIDGRLIALDASTGKPVVEFGKNGIIDLKKGVGAIQVTSPAAVINDLIVIGSTMGDNTRIDFPPGVVRAYDARDGKLVWSWDPIPRKPTDAGYDTWKADKAKKAGAANAWAPISADPSLDMAYVSTSCPSTDYYGGERKGNNLYANSIVAIKASTGKVVWHFQTVHHDIWDYDIPAQPLLIELERNGKKVPAVVVVTKMGHIFVLDRKTGEHLFPVEERPVPASDVPGEEAAKTQPFPAQLPALGLQKVTEDDAWGPTPELLQQAKDRINKHVNHGIFTPPSLKGSIITPSNVGGMNWSGASYDPQQNLLITNVNHLAALITLFPKTDNTTKAVNTALPRAEVAPQEGTPYIMSREYLFTIDNGQFVMQTKPPWGTLAAVDLVSGKLKWEVPLGVMMDPAKYPDAVKWGSINLGGAITTAGGLTFIASCLDGLFRAFDTGTGEMLWQSMLPAGGQATPMTYELNGKQYVVIAAGGHGKLGTKLGDYVVAYALEK